MTLALLPQDHAAAIGSQLLAGLGELAAKCNVMGNVRGAGLFLGIEVVTDRHSKVAMSRFMFRARLAFRGFFQQDHGHLAPRVRMGLRQWVRPYQPTVIA